MADEKISAMPPAGDMLLADIMPIVSAGVNDHITRANFLKAHAGEQVAWVSGAQGVVGFTSTGIAALIGAAGAGCEIVSVLGSGIIIDPAGVIGISCPGAAHITLVGPTGGASVTISPSGLILNGGAGTINMQYAVGTPGDWAGGGATDVWAALDRIASAVAGLLGGPIP